MAFRGHFDHSLDAKNRLSIPAKFRAAFSSGLVLSKFLEPCIAIWTPDGFERFTEDQKSLNAEISGIAESLGHPS